MADILLDALKPYMSAGAYKDLPYSTYGEFDRTQFSPDYSLGLMKEYNRSYNLGLTDAQIAAGIKAFGDRHQSQFGVGISALSNPVAVAAESIERALATAGKDPGPFWAKASPYLSQGEDMAQRNWNNTSTATQTEQRAATSQGEDWFGDLVMTAAPLIMSAAVGGAFSPGGLFGGSAGAAGAAGLDAAALGAGDAMAGLIPAGELGAWTGAAGGLGTGGSNMGIFDDLLSQFTDVPVDATQFADQSIVDLFNNAGTEGFSNYGQSLEELAAELFNNAGTPGFDQLGNQATGLDWLKSQLGGPGSNTSTIQNAIKALTGGGGTGGTGQGGSLLGAGLGGLAGLLGGAKQAGTTDVTQTPWGPQQPFLLDAWSKAKAASEANNPLRNQAESNYQSVLQGPTKNPMLGLDNPYLQTQIDNANNDVTRAMMPAMIQANKASGSFGNSGVADIYGKAMTDAYSKNANDMRYKDYYAQQQLQKDAVGNTLGFTTGSSQFNAAPAQDYAKTVQGSYGGTTSSPYFTNPASSMLGGATLGYNLFGGK